MLIGLLVFGCARPPPPEPVGEALGGTIATRFGDWPFLTPIDAPSTIALVTGERVSSRAETCGGCHTDHYAEWRATTHAAAIHDAQYLAELAKPDQPRWLCLNCHAPTAPQRAERITADTRLVGLDIVREANPTYDAAMTGEGVTCAACHVRRDADGEGVVVGPRGSGRAPHRVRADKATLDNVCEQCHSPGAATLTPTFTCWFESKEEVAAGPAAGTSCVECHMPTTSRPAAAGAPTEELRRHVWVGGGVPKTYAGYDTLLARGWTSGLDVTVDSDGNQLTVRLQNARAGHALPTADPERHLRVEAARLDATGRVIAEDRLRIGQVWDWGDAATGRPARRLSDDRLRAGETRAWSPRLPGEGELRVDVWGVRLTAENAGFMARAEMDDELRALWPEGAAAFPGILDGYPRETLVWRAEVHADGTRRVWTPEEMMAVSRDRAP